MRKNFKIILDVDDVLLECNQYALITLNHAYGYDYGLWSKCSKYSLHSWKNSLKLTSIRIPTVFTDM